MTLDQILADVRIRLDDPMAQHPSLRHLVSIATSHWQNYHNELSNTGVPWTIGSWPLSVGAEQDEYTVMAPNFGKLLYVHTNSSDPNELEREILVIDPQNFDQFGKYPRVAQSAEPYSAEVMALYGLADGTWKIKIRPVPNQSAEYLIWYETGVAPDPSMGSQAPLAEHHHLLVSRIAVAALPYSRWTGLDVNLTAEKRRELGLVLVADLNRYEEQFERYIRNQRQEQMHARLAHGWQEDW